MSALWGHLCMTVEIWIVLHKMTPLPVHSHLMSDVARRHITAQMCVRLSTGIDTALARHWRLISDTPAADNHDYDW